MDIIVSISLFVYLVLLAEVPARRFVDTEHKANNMFVMDGKRTYSSAKDQR